MTENGLGRALAKTTRVAIGKSGSERVVKARDISKETVATCRDDSCQRKKPNIVSSSRVLADVSDQIHSRGIGVCRRTSSLGEIPFQYRRILVISTSDGHDKCAH